MTQAPNDGYANGFSSRMTEPVPAPEIQQASAPETQQASAPETQQGASSSTSRKRPAPSDIINLDDELISSSTTAATAPTEVAQPPRSRPRIERVSTVTLFSQLESRFANDDSYLDRLDRAYTQHMNVVRVTFQGSHKRVFAVRGNTGTIYRVTIGKNMSCSCPDYVGHCKHLLMVLLKVFHVNVNSNAYRVMSLDFNTISSIFENYQRTASCMTGAREIHDLEYESEEEEELEVCPVCKENIEDLEDTLPCQWCNTFGHPDCIMDPPWLFSRRHRERGVCEHCHADIEDYDSDESTRSDYYFSAEYKVKAKAKNLFHKNRIFILCGLFFSVFSTCR
ncbi:hypothetical protein BDA99DRAFT_520780 [Phascolomyces articulosus]|uniref:SWIM-type domain-containing protein n=1 Tax=Phascolomyces articulosus TaxID=60185 RepID=A0AAD5K2J6_9FUNG|nr:hypothetical protein BDA99DRAFT_520780 [Phascolomyces articulosus]